MLRSVVLNGQLKRRHNYGRAEIRVDDLADRFGGVAKVAVGGSGPDLIAGFAAMGSDEWHDAKGLKLQKKDCRDVFLTWSSVAKIKKIRKIVRISLN